jgi:hypothetical protein
MMWARWATEAYCYDKAEEAAKREAKQHDRGGR